MATTKQPTKKPVAVQVVESLTSSARVDREAGMIRGAKLIGFNSKNGRYYPPNVLKAAVAALTAGASSRTACLFSCL